ncbi:hypothetical protein G7Z17_g12705 [Cylindrodendrum hubeiense]|uniref:Uncharacterized protein n=1 Tax=Cylindrodendrum hubeiense TaxID=595255 RepID=A0A9P5GYE4_9HYPO|nr:hypothetical protein G7Z17_g12705 [Cylindrodendrum hubeiense]
MSPSAPSSSSPISPMPLGALRAPASHGNGEWQTASEQVAGRTGGHPGHGATGRLPGGVWPCRVVSSPLVSSRPKAVDCSYRPGTTPSSAPPAQSTGLSYDAEQIHRALSLTFAPPEKAQGPHPLPLLPML